MDAPNEAKALVEDMALAEDTALVTTGELAVELTGLFHIRQFLLELNARFGKGVDTIFKVQFGDLSLGTMIEYLVGLAKPGFRLQLDPPWDVINSINLRHLTFMINVTQNKIGFSYDGIGLDLTFLKLDKIEVFFATQGKRSVDISVFGRLLTEDFTKKPLTWDLLTQRPPAVPTQGAKIFDLEYLGFGQRVTLRDIDKLETLGEVMDALTTSYRDVAEDQNPLDQLPALKFDTAAGWLIGAKFSALETVALSAVFNDPKMYGLRLALSGPRAKALAGLEFEILYQRVSDDIGKYHIELKVPDAFRQIQAGAASITLPIIDLDIYTNGNFLVDLGFPHNLDFARSFVVQVMIGPVPVIGAGGFYFGILSGKTSDAVPQISNGEFVPVIVFGVGARLGVGKTFDKGILRAGAFVAFQGLLEGVLGFFQPTSPDVDKATFYRIRGAIGIVAHIYGVVDFSIVKATLDLYAYATVQAVFEAYLPTVLTFEAGVEVKLSVKISLGLFSVKLHFSFSATFKTSTQIGSAEKTPWVLASGQASASNEAFFTHLEGRGFYPLEGGRVHLDDAFARMAETPLRWYGVRVFDDPEDADADELTTLTLTFHTLSSIGFVDDHPEAGRTTCPSFGPNAKQQVELAAVLFIEGPPTDDSGDEELSDFALLAKKGLLWAIDRTQSARRFALLEAGERTSDDGEVTLSELHYAYNSLSSPDAVDVCDIVDFLRLNFAFEIAPPPTDDAGIADAQQKSYVAFPMLPFLSLAAGDGAYAVDFATQTPCDEDYRRFLAWYFDQLAAENTPARPQLERAVSAVEDTPSMTACLMMDYVLIILRQVLERAIDLYASYPYDAAPNDTLDGIARRFGLIDAGAVARIVRANQGEAGFLAAGTTVQVVASAERTGDNDSLSSLASRVGLQAVNVAQAIQDQNDVLLAAAELEVAGGVYTLQPDDTFDAVAKRFFTTVEALEEANPGLAERPSPPGQSVPVGLLILLPTTSFPIGQRSLAEIAELFRVSVADLATRNTKTPILQAGVRAFFPLVAEIEQGETLDSLAKRFALTVADLLPVIGNQQGWLVSGVELALTGGSYLLRENDTVAAIAARYGTSQSDIFAANPGFDWTPPPGLQVPWGKTIALPEVHVALGAVDPLDDRALDSLAAVARFVGLALAGLAAQIQGDAKLLRPLAPVQLGVLPVTVGADDTLDGIAQRFGVLALDLALANPGPETRFGQVLVPEVEILPTATLLAELAARGDFTAATGMVSRFLLYGLRLPAPGEIHTARATGCLVDGDPASAAELCLYPLYTLSGQQWAAPEKPSESYAITLTRNAASDPCQPPKITFQSDTPESGLTTHLGPLDVEAIEGFAKLLGTGEPPFDPGLLALTRLAPYNTVARHFSLGKALPWRSPSVPLFTAEPLPQTATTPSLYDLPRGLRALLRPLAGRPAPLVLEVGRSQLASGPQKAARPAQGYGFATRFEIRLRQAPAPGTAKSFLPALFEVYSGDAASRQAMLDLVTWLRGPGQGDDVTLHLLYAANPTGGQDQGLVSDAADPASVLLLKTNLSTLTRSPSSGFNLLERPQASEEGLFSADLGQAASFLTLLWEASVVNSGGYYLSYDIGDGKSLPAQLFNQDPEAALTVLAVIRPAGQPQTIGLQPFHNAVIFTENLSSDDAVVFAEASRFPVPDQATWNGLAATLDVTPFDLAEANATLPRLLRPGVQLDVAGTGYTVLPGDDLLTVSLDTRAALDAVAAALGDRDDVLLAGAELFRGTAWVERRASLPMGNEGFRMVRRDPDPDLSAGLDSMLQDDDPATALAARFNLVGFRLADAGGFQQSPAGSPATPAESTGGGTGGHAGELLGLPATADGQPPWLYQRALAVAPYALAALVDPPVPGPDPYAGLGQQASVELDLQDLLGNRGLAQGSVPDVDITVLYRDPVLGLDLWPASSRAYRFVKADGGAQLELSFGFDPSHYTPPPSTPFAALADRAAKDRDAYRQIYWQVTQSSLSFLAQTTVDGSTDHPLDRKAFLPLVVGAWSLLDTLAAAEQLTVTVPAASQNRLDAIATPYHTSVADLAAVNSDDAELLLVGAEVEIPRFVLVVLNDTVESLLQRSGSTLSAGELGALNKDQALEVGTVMQLPGGGSHTIVAGDTLQKVGAEQQPPISPAELAELDKAVRNLFPQEARLSLGRRPETIAKGDTFASLARRHGLGVALLAEHNAARQILTPGASCLVPSHLGLGSVTSATHLITDGDTFAKVAAAYDTTVPLLGLANQDLDGILAVGQSWTYGGHTETVAENDTLATLLARFRAALDDSSLNAGALAAANQDKGVLQKGGRMLVAPPVVAATVAVSASAFPGPIFPLTVAAVLRRDKALVDPAFSDIPDVLSASAFLSPLMSSSADSGLALSDFAADFEAAFDRKLRLATGSDAASDQPTETPRLFAVQWQTAVLGYKIGPEASFFAPRPLLNTPWAGSAPIRPYRSGEPLGTSQNKRFEGIDLDTWGRSFLATMDRVLGPGAALATFDLTPQAFDRLAAAKDILAQAISRTVSPVLDGDAGDLDAAQSTLEQQLLIELSTAYTVDTLVQFPVTITSPYSDPATAPRLAGKPRGATYVLGAGITPEQLADHFGAPIDLVATVIANVTEILQPGFDVRFDGKDHRVVPTDTLATVAKAVDTDPPTLLDALRATAGFLRAGAGLNLVRRQYAFTELDTLATAIGRLALGTTGDQTPDSALINFTAMSQRVPDIFRAGKKLVIGEHEHVTQKGDDLVTIAAALEVKPLAVVEHELDTEELVEIGTVVAFLILAPGFSLSDAKIPLAAKQDASSALTFLFQGNSELAHLTLDLAYQVQELEVAIADVSWARGYQTSSWLSFILPVQDDAPGRIDIPIPLRAYPRPPVVTGQSLEQKLPADPQLEQIKTYDYLYDFTYLAAAQDTLFTSYELNIPGSDASRALADAPTLPQTLAQYAAIAKALAADLALLTVPGALDAPGLKERARNAVEIFSDLAEKIAATWTTWAPPTATERDDRPLYRLRHRRGRDGRSRLRVQAMNALAAARPLPEIRLCGRRIDEEIRGDGFAVHTLAAPDTGDDSFVNDVYQARVPDLDVIGAQNIWGSVAVKRNYDLIPGKKTRPEFVYQLADVRFTSKFVPFIEYPKAFDVTSLPPYHGEPDSPRLLEYVIRLFANLLLAGEPAIPQARNLRVAASFGFVLANEGQGAQQDIETRVPVILQPVFLFDPSTDLSPTSGFCFELASQLESWQKHHQADASPDGRWIFDVSVYSTLPNAANGEDGATQPPLLELKNFYLSFVDVGAGV